jgi:hypothetical protein
MQHTTNQQQRPLPRLVKAAELAERSAKREVVAPAAKSKPEVDLEAIVRKAAARARAARGDRDARSLFNALFEKPAA